MLSQLLLVFGFFALVLVGIYWINRAVILIDTFLGAGHSGLMVLELSVLSLPTLIKLVMPIAAFLAVIYTTNRLYAESELVVVQATGFSGFRLARPVLAFGLIVAAVIALLSHLLVPLSVAQLNAKEQSLAEAASTRLLVPGSFTSPTDGVTIYSREITTDGDIMGLLMADRRNPQRHTTYTAERARFIRDADGPKLVMFNGLAQTLDTATDRLSTTHFADFTVAIGTLISAPKEGRLDPQQLSTPALFRADQATQDATRRDATYLRREAYSRFAESTLPPALCVMGFAAMMLGTFSRFGLWRQISLGVALVVAVKLLDNAVQDMAKDNANAWPVVYLPSLIAALIACALLWVGGGRLGHLLRRLRKGEPA